MFNASATSSARIADKCAITDETPGCISVHTIPSCGKRLLLECLKLNYITFKEDHRFQALGYLGPVTEKTT